jgi:hypothetical protein
MNVLSSVSQKIVWAQYQDLTDGLALICPRFSMKAQSARRYRQTFPLFEYFVKSQNYIEHDSIER